MDLQIFYVKILYFNKKIIRFKMKNYTLALIIIVFNFSKKFKRPTFYFYRITTEWQVNRNLYYIYIMWINLLNQRFNFLYIYNFKIILNKITLLIYYYKSIIIKKLCIVDIFSFQHKLGLILISWQVSWTKDFFYFLIIINIFILLYIWVFNYLINIHQL